MNLMGVGPIELMVILLVALLVLGPARLAPTARSLGKLIRDFRSSTENIPSMIEDFIEGNDQSPNHGNQSGSNPLPTPCGTKSRRKRDDTQENGRVNDETNEEQS
ncbi:hypothetical protein FIM02_02800 [SAR202 cluster bacterium AD-802-E10_MRT_200m]|nr:hypothetical protein [SAR202 cluster bacterium AD-802-E10_MRT_200m]